MSWGAAMSACRWRCSLRCDGQGSSRPFGLDPDQSRDLLADLADPASWPALFAASPLVGSEQEEGETPRWPLRLWGDRLYLTRYHDFELGVARHLRALSERAEWPEIAPALSRLFARDYGLVFAAPAYFHVIRYWWT